MSNPPIQPGHITLYCPQCGYDLTGLTRDVCPECGYAFDRYQLLLIGGIKHPRIDWPMAVLFLPPAIAAVGLLFALMIGAQINDTLINVLWISVATIAGGSGIGTSIFAGRRIARRIMMRPPKSRPNLGSVALTILFACVFFGAQLGISLMLFFVGCLILVLGMAA